jgi:hypothetical protein
MKYDVFMYTRTFDADYAWGNKPDYMPPGIQETCQSIIALARDSSFDSLNEGDWYSCFYYLRVAGCCLLARLAKTVYTDNNDQSIFTFEGVAVPETEERLLFYNIPNLVNELMPPAKSFRAKYEESGFVAETFEVEGVVPLFGTDVLVMIHPALKSTPAFRNLLQHIAFSTTPTGFMFGKNARTFSNYVSKANLQIEKVFDADNPDPSGVDEGAFMNAYKPLEVPYTAPIATGRDKVTVNLFVQETGENEYRYKWVVMPWDTSTKDGNRVRYSTRFYDIHDQVELSKLELQKEAIRKYLLDSGWTKQQFGLRFEKDIFQREVK